jgi:hypothetical protein
VNQTAHVLVDEHHRSNLLDVRTYRGSNADSGRCLGTAQLKCRTAPRNDKNIPKVPLKCNTERLGTKIKQGYFKKLVNRVYEMGENNLNLAALQQIVVNTPDEVTSTEERAVGNGRFD